MESNEQELSLKTLEDAKSWSSSPESKLYRKILRRRIDETWEELLSQIGSQTSVEEIGATALRAVSRIEGLLSAIEESEYYDDGDG